MRRIGLSGTYDDSIMFCLGRAFLQWRIVYVASCLSISLVGITQRGLRNCWSPICINQFPQNASSSPLPVLCLNEILQLNSPRSQFP